MDLPVRPKPRTAIVLFYIITKIHNYRSLSVAKPTSANMTEIIQNRITIWGSAHPNFSKW